MMKIWQDWEHFKRWLVVNLGVAAGVIVGGAVIAASIPAWSLRLVLTSALGYAGGKLSSYLNKRKQG